jgi:uncharacterized protein (TIGR02300 family)
MRFYDFKRSPIICPGCGTEFDPENLVKGRKGRAAPKSASKAQLSGDADDADYLDNNDFDLDEDEDVDTDTAVDEIDDDIDFDDDDDVDVDDADGPGIIHDDISDGDELLPNLDEKDD